MDETRLLRLLRSIEDTLSQLSREALADSVRTADPLWLPGVKYLLLSAIEGCMDVAQHLCATERWGPPNDNGDAMRLLGEREVLTRALAQNMRMAVGMRNVLVHEYVSVDDDVVRARVHDHSDLQAFCSEVSAWVLSRH